MEYKNDKRTNEISAHDRRECQYYEQIDMSIGQRTSVVNQMPASAQEYDDHHSMHTTQQNSPAIATKEKKNSR